MQNLESKAVTLGLHPSGTRRSRKAFCLHYHHMVELKWKTCSRDKMGSGRRQGDQGTHVKAGDKQKLRVGGGLGYRGFMEAALLGMQSPHFSKSSTQQWPLAFNPSKSRRKE